MISTSSYQGYRVTKEAEKYLREMDTADAKLATLRTSVRTWRVVFVLAFALISLGVSFSVGQSVDNDLTTQRMQAEADVRDGKITALADQVRRLGGTPVADTNTHIVKGTPGQTGSNGSDGLNGTDGKAGDPGTDGLNGENGVDGRPGSDGSDGSNGKDGADGKTPACFYEPNQCQGAQGIPGTPGSKGDTGATGSKGDQGDPGKTGAPGRGITDRTYVWDTENSQCLERTSYSQPPSIEDVPVGPSLCTTRSK